jgi:predicted ATP-dependent endonuclease of OLD family
MRLVVFSLAGYRRFVERTSVKLHGDLVAFVGPNEAGKSSLLNALAHLGTQERFLPSEKPRRTAVEPSLFWLFQLESDDRSAIAEIHDTSAVPRAVVGKRADGTRTWRSEPQNPRRNRSRRVVVADAMRKHRDDEVLSRANDDSSSEFTLEDFDRAYETLMADVENYDAGHLDGLRDVARRLRTVEFPQLSDIDAENADRDEMVAPRERHRWSGQQVARSQTRLRRSRPKKRSLRPGDGPSMPCLRAFPHPALQ